MSGIKLSILMPTIPSRKDTFDTLFQKIQFQIGQRDDVEVIALLDNKKSTVGAKCNRLLQMAQGDSITFVDDDDDISTDYVSSILEAIHVRHVPDVVTFQISCVLKWRDKSIQRAMIWPDVNDPNEEFHGEVVRRKPLRIAVWRNMLACQESFPDVQYGEDAAWASQLWPKVKTQIKIPKVLYHYRWDETITEAK